MIGEDEVNRAFLRFKELADKKKEITNMDIESIVGDEAQDLTQNRFKLMHVQVLCVCALCVHAHFKIDC